MSEDNYYADVYPPDDEEEEDDSCCICGDSPALNDVKFSNGLVKWYCGRCI